MLTVLRDGQHVAVGADDGFLGANVRTVHKHVEHIFQKLGVETRNAAMLAALDVLRPPR